MIAISSLTLGNSFAQIVCNELYLTSDLLNLLAQEVQKINVTFIAVGIGHLYDTT